MTLHTLLVEDDEPHARLIVERLRDSRAITIVATTETLAEAIARLRDPARERVDAVLLDLNLPDSSGVATVRDLHLALPRVPIVVLSGQSDVDVALEAMRHGAQEYLLKNGADATNLTRALQLAIERKRLEDIEQMLVGVVSHDLRGPLQTILLGCDILDPEDKHVARIRRAALRATSLVNDLLDATRARLAGVLPLETRQVELGAIVRQVLDDVRVANPTRTIEVEIAHDTWATADAKRIAQVVQNLVGNAIQHSPSSSPIRVSLARDDAGFELAVQNGGAPIPEGLRSRIFEPLERASSQRDPNHSIGLGLYIVSEIVRAHGGEIEVMSDAAIGTVFRVRLPHHSPVCS